MNIYYLLFIIPIIFILSLKVTKVFNIYDYPDNHRKIHIKPTLLVGGIFFQIIFLFYFVIIYLLQKYSYTEMIYFYQNDHFLLLFTITCSFLIGLYDDKKNLKPILKLAIIFLIFYLSLTYFSDDYKLKKLISFTNYILYLDLNSVVFTSFCFVVLLNAINMADGINSLSSNIFIIWIFFINLFLPHENFYYFMNIVLMISLVLFSIFNFRKLCFMGDSGCFVLICYISFITVFTYNLNIENNLTYLNIESIFLLFMLPGIDMFRLFLKRIYQGRNPFRGDKDHLHHLLLNNLGNIKSLLIYNLLIIFPWLVYLLVTSLLPYLIIIVLIIYLLLISKLQNFYEKN